MRKSVFVVASAGALAFAFAGAVGAPGVAWGSTAQAAPPTIRDTNAQFGHGKMWAPGDPPVIRRSLQAPDGTPVIRDSKFTGPAAPPTIRDTNAHFGHPGLKKLWAPGDPPVITHSLTAPPGTPIIRDSKVTGPPDTPTVRDSLQAQAAPPTIRDTNAQFGHPGLQKLSAEGDPPVIKHSLTAPAGTPIIRDSKVTGPPDTPTVRGTNARPGHPGYPKLWGPDDPPVIRGANAQTSDPDSGGQVFSARTGDPDDGGQVLSARTGDPDDGGQISSASTSDPDDGGQVH